MLSSTCVISGNSKGVLRMEDEAKASERQGIGSILGSEPEKTKTVASLRRTLSADMSSKKWLGRHGFGFGFTPLKKIPSSESFPFHHFSSVDSPSSSSSSSSSSSPPPSPSTASLSEGEEDKEQVLGRNRKKPEQLVNWNSLVQAEKKPKEDLERPGLSDIWGSILSQKVEDSSKSSSAVYIPQPVKRAKSLSQKSLEICTESLGSETGSDGFSSRPPSESGEFQDKSALEEQSVKEKEQVSSEADPMPEQKFDPGAADYPSFTTQKATPRSFPPPLPSLSRREGPGVLMRSHRQEGRLVLEAVPVSSYNYFHCERQSGRLLLNFFKNPSEELLETDDEEEEEVGKRLELLEEEEMEKEVEADVFDGFEGFDGFDEGGSAERVEKAEEVDEIQETLTEVVKSSEPIAMMPSEVLGVHRSTASLTTKLIGLSSKNPTWSLSHRMNVELLEEEEEEEEEEEKTDEEEMEEEEPTTQLPQSLPCPPRVAHLIATPAAEATAAASLNAYDYFWRAKPSTAAATMYPTKEPLPAPPMINNNFCYYPNKLHNSKKSNISNKAVISKGGLKHQEQQKQSNVLRGNEADCLVPMVRGCKEPRRSLPINWQPPRCIAT